MQEIETNELVRLLKSTLEICPDPACCDILREKIKVLEHPPFVLDTREIEIAEQ